MRGDFFPAEKGSEKHIQVLGVPRKKSGLGPDWSARDSSSRYTGPPDQSRFLGNIEHFMRTYSISGLEYVL